ncbi:hypothetical protein FOA52_015011 [Chlamydomonas sp. UWO 241]|nr:hypothetical protein FOA52_015011 [Chlamydomonas sp. UWO 241]
MTECKRWLTRVVDDVRSRPQSPGLFDYFRIRKKLEDLTVPVVNHAHAFVGRLYSSKAPEHTQCVLLYYWVLNHIMQQLHPSSVRQEGRGPKVILISDKDSAHSKLHTVETHEGLLCIALEVVAAVKREGSQDLGTLFASIEAVGMQCKALSCCDACRWTQACFAPGQPHAMPAVLMGLLKAMEVRWVEELVLAKGSSVYESMFTGGGFLHEPGDMALVGGFITALANLAISRVAAVCARLPEPLVSAGGPAAFKASHTAASVAVMDYIISFHLDLCFEQHLSVLVACSAFSVAKAMKSTLQFKRVLQEIGHMAKTESVGRLTPLSTMTDCADLSVVFSAVPLLDAGGQDGSSGEGRGDVRYFYNSCFLPRAEEFVRECVAQNTKKGNGPEEAPTGPPPQPQQPQQQQQQQAPAEVIAGLGLQTSIRAGALQPNHHQMLLQAQAKTMGKPRPAAGGPVLPPPLLPEDKENMPGGGQATGESAGALMPLPISPWVKQQAPLSVTGVRVPQSPSGRHYHYR